MASNFPTSLDTNPGDPAPSTTLAAGGHANLHTFVQDAMIAVQGYLGIVGSAVTTSITYLVNHVTPARGGTGLFTYVKGDLLAAQSATVLARVPVGADGNILVADSTQASGMKWAGIYSNIQTYAPAPGATVTLDLSKGNIHHITMPAGNVAIALSNATVGQCFIVRILQDSVGSRTASYFTTIRWAGGSAPTLTTTANKADTVGFEITGASTYDGYVIGQNI